MTASCGSPRTAARELAERKPTKLKPAGAPGAAVRGEHRTGGASKKAAATCASTATARTTTSRTCSLRKTSARRGRAVTRQPARVRFHARGCAEDITTSEVLYCGTEFGFWASREPRRDVGEDQQQTCRRSRFTRSAQPTTASEIVVATHGRSVWVVDVASLRQMNAEVLKAPATLFAPATGDAGGQFAPGSFPYSRDVRKFYGSQPAHGRRHRVPPDRPREGRVAEGVGRERQNGVRL